jgi:hypothetical protein
VHGKRFSNLLQIILLFPASKVLAYETRQRYNCFFFALAGAPTKTLRQVYISASIGFSIPLKLTKMGRRVGLNEEDV